MLRSEDRLRCAKSNKASISSLEDTCVAVITEISPLRFANIALRVDRLEAAVELVTEFVVDGVRVDLEELRDRHGFLSCVVLCNFIPQDLGLLISVKALIGGAFGDPWVKREDD